MKTSENYSNRIRFPDGSPYSKEGWVYPILLCCHDKVGIGESNPGGHELEKYTGAIIFCMAFYAKFSYEA